MRALMRLKDSAKEKRVKVAKVTYAHGRDRE